MCRFTSIRSVWFHVSTGVDDIELSEQIDTILVCMTWLMLTPGSRIICIAQTGFLRWVCTIQILHIISRRQGRIYLIYMIYLSEDTDRI